MKILERWQSLFNNPTKIGQNYNKDKRHKYVLILINQSGDTYRKFFSTSVPLEANHRIALAPDKTFVVVQIVHVVYNTQDGECLTRPTTFIHAGIKIAVESNVTESDLAGLGFELIDNIFPHTVH